MTSLLRRPAFAVTTATVAALALGGSYIAMSALQPAGPNQVAGPKPGNKAITPIGYAVTPAGAQTTIGHLPLNAAMHPDGRHLLVTNDGQAMQSIQLIDATTSKVTQTLEYASPESVYIGLAWSPDGRTAYASAAANSKVRVFSFDGKTLTEKDSLKLPTTTPDGKPVKLFPAGLAVSRDGGRVLVAGQLGNSLTSIDVATGESQTAAVGHRPVWVTLSRDGRTAYVSDQGDSTLDVVDVSGATPVVTGRIRVGLHPNKSILAADGRTLYVADGDSDTVSVVDTRRGRTTGTIKVGGTSTVDKNLIGSNPTGLAVDEAGHLFVSNSGTNDVAVVSLKSGAVTGRIPTAWYPSSVTYDSGRLFVTNAKGYGAGPNDGEGRPDPEATTPTSPDQYSGGMIDGTLSTIPVPGKAQLAAMTRQVARNNAPVRRPGSVVPAKPGDATPIKHVIYVVKENRTYDQVMGDLEKGDGDPSLTLFGDDAAPNMRELARRFVTFDNFYADAEVSANGWNWVAQANSNPYSEAMWPQNYSGRKGVYPSENNAPEIAAQKPGRNFIWNKLDAADVSFANFGFYVERKRDAMVADEDPVLNRRTDHGYQGYDLSCPDSAGTFVPQKTDCMAPRVDRWLKSFDGYVKKGQMPTVQFVRLGNDHTWGSAAGRPTPKAMVADNDLAVGRLVEAVSKSPYWKDTVILMTEDDAQNGPDHVDAHRTLAWAISPYTQTGKVDSTFYSTASMVRTLGLLAGVGPLTQFDAYATPMNRAFVPTPNLAPYTAIRPTTDMKALNAKTAPMAKQSAAQNLGVADAIDEKTFNEAIWKSVKGANSPMPAPRYSVLGDTARAQREAQKVAESRGVAVEEDDD